MASAMLGLIILSAGTLALLISLAIVSGYMNGRFVIGSALLCMIALLGTRLTIRGSW